MMHPLPPPALIRPHMVARVHTEPSLLTPGTDSRPLLLQLLPGTEAIYSHLLFISNSMVLSSAKFRDPTYLSS